MAKGPVALTAGAQPRATGSLRVSVVWVVCGAGRGVGKTVVATELCRVLPDSVYAKCGHGRAKPSKPENFFNTVAELETFLSSAARPKKHAVVESNVLARSGRGDVTVFLDGVPGKTHFRRDTEQLRAAADVAVSPDSRGGDWKRALHGKLPSRTLCDAACDVLAAQQRWLFGLRPLVACKVWFEASGSRIFGRGLADLLERVGELGSLQEAARAVDISYRHAWDMIRTAEKHLESPLVIRHAGGAHGGGSTLSAEGERLLGVFRRLSGDVADFAAGRFAELYGGPEKTRA